MRSEISSPLRVLGAGSGNLNSEEAMRVWSELSLNLETGKSEDCDHVEDNRGEMRK